MTPVSERSYHVPHKTEDFNKLSSSDYLVLRHRTRYDAPPLLVQVLALSRDDLGIYDGSTVIGEGKPACGWPPTRAFGPARVQGGVWPRTGGSQGNDVSSATHWRSAANLKHRQLSMVGVTSSADWCAPHMNKHPLIYAPINSMSSPDSRSPS